MKLPKNMTTRLIGLLAFGFSILLVSYAQNLSAATDTGGYPWADASPISLSTYDWGYTSCQPAMRLAGTCTSHVSTKAGIKYYESDPWRYDVRNCTSYVAWRVNSQFGISIPGWGNASKWADNARKAGYRVDTSPAVGSIAQWASGYGHVAFVTAVNPDGSVNVEQYNKAGTGLFSRQSRVRAVNYIHVEPPTPAIPAVVQPVPVTTAAAASVAPVPIVTAPVVPTPVPVETLKPLTPETVLNNPSKDIQYTLALDPTTHQVNIFAVHFSNTASKNIEISKSSGADGNTSWEKTWITKQPQAVETDTQFAIADYNADGVLDLYAITSPSATGTNVDIMVLNGASNYTKQLGDWQTPQTSPKDSVANYSLADYDGNGSLDLYKIDLAPVDAKARVTVLDASKNFQQSIGSWTTPEVAKSDAAPHFQVSDHDRDGKVDIYQLVAKPSETVPPAVTVFDATSNFQSTLCSWQPDTITKTAS